MEGGGRPLTRRWARASSAGAASSAAKTVRFPRATLALFSLGIAVFSGSCYAAALSGDRAMGKLAPLGGTTLIAAWMSLAI